MSVKDTIRNVKALAGLRMPGPVPTTAELEGDDRVKAIVRIKFPEEDPASALALVVIHDAWERIYPDLRSEFDSKGWEAPGQPVLAAAPIGSLNACSIYDHDGNGALIFDSELLQTAACLLHEISLLVCKEEAGETSVDISPEAVSKSPSLDDCTLWMARFLSNSFRRGRTLDFLHAQRVFEFVGDRGPFHFLSQGFNTFIVCHEYAHFLYRHHEVLESAKKAGMLPSNLQNLRHRLEYDADDFAFRAAMRVGLAFTSRPDFLANQVLRMFGVLTFLSLCACREKIRKRLIKGGFFDTPHSAAGQTPTCGEYLHRQPNTHPPAADRLARIQAGIVRQIDSEATQEPLAPFTVLKLIMDLAEARFMSATEKNGEQLKKKGFFSEGEVALGDIHLSLVA